MKTYRKSKTTKVLALRLLNEVVDTLERRARKQGISLHEYTRRRLSYDTLRKHEKVSS